MQVFEVIWKVPIRVPIPRAERTATSGSWSDELKYGRWVISGSDFDDAWRQFQRDGYRLCRLLGVRPNGPLECVSSNRIIG